MILDRRGLDYLAAIALLILASNTDGHDPGDEDRS